MDEGRRRSRAVRNRLGTLRAGWEHTYDLDLVGLSWCGLDVRDPKHPRARNTMTDTDLRRNALIAMLNGVQAQLQPVEEAAEHRPLLALSAYEALRRAATLRPVKGGHSR